MCRIYSCITLYNKLSIIFNLFVIYKDVPIKCLLVPVLKKINKLALLLYYMYLFFTYLKWNVNNTLYHQHYAHVDVELNPLFVVTKMYSTSIL